MTLNDIIIAALRQLERGTNVQVIDKYRDVFTDHANAGIRRLATRFKVTRIDTVALDSNKQFNVNSLSRSCMTIFEIKNESGAVMSWDEVSTGVIEVSGAEANANVKVLYRYIPTKLTSPTDTPELPSYMHDAIAYYVVGMQRCGGDGDSQPTASVYFDLFNREVMNIQSCHYGAASGYTLKNRW